MYQVHCTYEVAKVADEVELEKLIKSWQHLNLELYYDQVKYN